MTQTSPNPGMASDPKYLSSLYAFVTSLNTAAGILLRQGDDVAAIVNQSTAGTRFVLLPGAYGKAGTTWTLTRPAVIEAVPGAIIYCKMVVQGAGTRLINLQFEGEGQVLMNSNGCVAQGLYYGQTCAASPLLSDNGVFNRYLDNTSFSVVPGAVGLDVTGSSAVVVGNAFVAHPISVRYNVAGGHQLAGNLGTIVGV